MLGGVGLHNRGVSLSKYPQQIDIRFELERAHAILGKRERVSKHYPLAGL
jgi:hypothetical protein